MRHRHDVYTVSGGRMVDRIAPPALAALALVTGSRWVDALGSRVLPLLQDMLAAGAVDCLQADVTRCGGITGFQRVGALCDAHTIDLSAHCAPTISAHVCAAQWHFRHIEFFHDHVRIERMLFDGRLDLVDGCLVPDRSRPGLGLELKRADAKQYQVVG